MREPIDGLKINLTIENYRTGGKADVTTRTSTAGMDCTMLPEKWRDGLLRPQTSVDGYGQLTPSPLQSRYSAALLWK